MDDVEEELAEFVKETFGNEEIDMDYEFDAPRFFDLSRAETFSEAKEAERWFQFAGDYPPSPFVIKLNWRQGMPMRVVNTFDESKDIEENVNANNRDRGVNYRITQDLTQAKAKCQVKAIVPRISTLMKPTLSHLAKQNHISIASLRLHKKLGNIDDISSQNSSIIDDLATKRQKLEAGYSSKNAQLKHRALLLHKTKEVGLDGVMANSRPKYTIPREPDLETAHRAERRRQMVTAELVEREKSICCTLKAHGTNRKSLKAPSLPLTRRSKQNPVPQEKELLDCNLPSVTTESKRPDSANSLRKEKCNTVNNRVACCPNKMKLSVTGKFCISRNINQGHNFSTDKWLQDEPPVHQFSKLCVTSESQENTKHQSKTLLSLQSKGTREKIPGSFQEHKIIDEVRKKIRDQMHCRSHLISQSFNYT